MFRKDIYKYIDEKGRTVVSPHKPTCEFELMYRLIAHSEEYLLTNYIVFTPVIDIPTKDLELWVEVHKDDLESPISTKEEFGEKIQVLEGADIDIQMALIELYDLLMTLGGEE